MSLSDDELQRRRPVWDAMSDVFLDTETRSAMPRVALVLARSGYDAGELETIWRDEIIPECAWNLTQVAGEWALFVLDEEALAARASGKKPLVERVIGVSIPAFLESQWSAILALRSALLVLPERERARRTTMWTVFVHVYLERSLEGMSFLEHQLDALRGTGAPEDELVAVFQDVRPVLRSLLTSEEAKDEARRATDVRVAIGLATQAAP